jgi:hypothetical protein
VERVLEVWVSFWEMQLQLGNNDGYIICEDSEFQPCLQCEKEDFIVYNIK